MLDELTASEVTERSIKRTGSPKEPLDFEKTLLRLGISSTRIDLLKTNISDELSKLDPAFKIKLKFLSGIGENTQAVKVIDILHADAVPA
jgi:hypothetical protein